MSIVRPWAASKSKAELTDLFQEFAIPGAPVATPGDLLQDPLLLHRQAFQAIDGNKSTPVAPHRIEQVTPSPEPAESESSASETGKLPLAGMRILDLGIITAGAGSTGLLADLGAEVLKIESHTYPDPFRHWAGSSDSPLFNFNNRNKYGVAIDLKTEAGKAQFLSLVKTADAVVENFRRGVLDRMGLGFDVLKAANPNILLLSISGQGSSGPGVGHTTFGSTLEASSGFAANTCYDDGLPWITGRNVNYPDQTVCFYAAAIAGLAMTHCRETNQALQIDVSQRDVAVYILGEVFEHVSSGGTDSVEETRRLTADYTFEGIYPCQDGRWVALATSKTEALTEITGLQGQLTHESLAGWAGARDADEAANQLLDNGIGAAKVLHGSEMYKHPVVEGHGTFTLCPGGTLVKGFPFELQHCEMTIWGDAPQVGEHSSKFLKEE
jgi:crotonobetainyl-CoA:carnitine CoA-transferase CaiB-like acyl-CoA transferase